MDDRARMLPTLPPLAVADVVSRESAFTMTRPPIAVRVTSRAYAWVVPRTMENTSAPDTAPLRIAPAIEIARALASTTWSASASIRTPASVAVIVEPMANAETVLVTVLSDLDRPDAAPAMRLPVPLSSSTEASIPELSRAWTRTPPRVARTTESSRMKASTVAVVWLDECAPASAWASEMVETEMPSAAATEVAAIHVVVHRRHVLAGDLVDVADHRLDRVVHRVLSLRSAEGERQAATGAAGRAEAAAEGVRGDRAVGGRGDLDRSARDDRRAGDERRGGGADVVDRDGLGHTGRRAATGRAADARGNGAGESVDAGAVGRADPHRPPTAAGDRAVDDLGVGRATDVVVGDRPGAGEGDPGARAAGQPAGHPDHG